MRSFKTEGIIIKRRNFGEADRIVTVFTRLNGKIQVKAVGVRRITSRRSSHIELLNHCVLTLYKGKSLPLLTEVETLENFSDIKEDLTKVGFAYHICELIDGLCPENQEQKAVFSLLANCLRQLSLDEPVARVIHEFEIELLSALGYWPKSRPAFDTQYVIEKVLERRLKSKPILSQFLMD